MLGSPKRVLQQFFCILSTTIITAFPIRGAVLVCVRVGLNLFVSRALEKDTVCRRNLHMAISQMKIPLFHVPKFLYDYMAIDLRPFQNPHENRFGSYEFLKMCSMQSSIGTRGIPYMSYSLNS